MDSTVIESPAGDNIKKLENSRKRREQKKRARERALIALQMLDNSEKTSDCKVAIDNSEKMDLTAQPPSENPKIDVGSTEILSEVKLKLRKKRERKKRAKIEARIGLEMHVNSEKMIGCKIAIDNSEKTDLTAQPPSENLKIEVGSTEILSEVKLKLRKKRERKKRAKIEARIGLEMHDNSEKMIGCKIAIDNSEKTDLTAQPPGENLKIDVGSTEILPVGKSKRRKKRERKKRAKIEARIGLGMHDNSEKTSDCKVAIDNSEKTDSIAQPPGENLKIDAGSTDILSEGKLKRKKRKKRNKKKVTDEDGAQRDGPTNTDAKVRSTESPVEDEAQTMGQTRKKRRKRNKKKATVEDGTQSKGQTNNDAKVGSSESPVEDEAQSTGQTKKKSKKRNKKKATIEDGAQSEGHTNTDAKVGSTEIPVEGAQSMVQTNVDVGSTENPTEGNVTKKRKRKPKKATVEVVTQNMGQTNVGVGSTKNSTEGNVTGERKRKPKKATVEDETQSVGQTNANVGSIENLTEGNVIDKRKKKRKNPKKAPVEDEVQSVGQTNVDMGSTERKMKRSKIDVPIISTRRKLLVLDLNGLLADIVTPPPKHHKGDTRISGREIFKRPFCDDFLKFCFDNFDVGIWSSRSKVIIDRVVDYLLGGLQSKLLFCWDMSHSTQTGVKTLENYHKPMVCKELRKIWENENPTLGWKKGDYNESNTLLLDDSPYKALLNPLHTAIFPDSYSFMHKKDDNSIGPGGDLRVYLEGLLTSENVQKYVEQHPFGQRAITEKNVSWKFYSEVLNRMSKSIGK